MSTQVVELTGDEAALLRSLQKVIDKERDHERQLGRIADAGDAAGLNLEQAMQRVEAANTKAIQQSITDLGRLGPQGKLAAESLKAQFTELGNSDFKTVESILSDLTRINPAAAEAAAATREALAEIDRQQSFDETIASMRALGGNAAKIADGIRLELQSADSPNAFDNFLGKLTDLHPAAAEVAARIRSELDTVDRQQSFDETIASMRALGGNAAKIADGIREELRKSANTPEAFNDYLNQLRALDPAAAEVAQTVRLRLEESDRNDHFKLTLGRLREVGSEGAKIANRLELELRQAAVESAGGMGAIVDELRLIDPAVAEAASRIRLELAEADAATQFDNTLSELRKLSPEAAKAAIGIRSEMSLADRQIKFDGIIAELRKVDPAAAAEAAKLRKTLETPAQSAKESWSDFAKSSITKIGGIAAAYVGVQEGVQLVNNYLEEQNALLDKSLQSQLTLAKAQQEAAKNLAAFSTVEQNEVLTAAVPKIALAAGVSDTSAITRALGDSASAGGTNEQVISAVQSAALLNRLTPDKIGTNASAAIDFAKSTGQSDARANLALLVSTGTQSRIEDPKALAESLAPAILNAVKTVPGQSKEDATREAAAIFATLTQASTDKTGNASQTATLDLTSRLSTFFTDFEAEQRNARSELSKLLPKVEEGKATESEAFRAEQLGSFLSQAASVRDSGTLFGRLETLQQNEGIRDQFFSTEFGQIAFKGAFKQLADSSSDLSQQLQNAKEKIEVDASGFERILNVTSSLTPQLRIANFVEGQKASAEVTDAFSTERAATKAVRDSVSQVLSRNRESGFGGYLSSFADENTFSSSLGGDTFAEEAVFGISKLRGRLRSLERGGLTDEEKPKALELQQEIERLDSFLREEVKSGLISEDSIAAAAERARAISRNFRQTGVSASGQRSGGLSRRDESESRYFESMAASLIENVQELKLQNQLMAEQNALLAETADNTAPVPFSPDPGAVWAAAIAQEDSR